MLDRLLKLYRTRVSYCDVLNLHKIRNFGDQICFNLNIKDQFDIHTKHYCKIMDKLSINIHTNLTLVDFLQS